MNASCTASWEVAEALTRRGARTRLPRSTQASPNHDRASCGLDHERRHEELIFCAHPVKKISSASSLFAVRKRDVCARQRSGGK